MKFKRILITSMLLIFTMCFSTISLAGVPDNLEVHEIKKTINEYFDTRYCIESNLNTNVNLEKFFNLKNVNGGVKSLENEKKYYEILVGHCAMQINDLRFKNYSYNLEYIDININKTTAAVTLLENADIYFNSSPDVKSQMAGLQHIIKLEKVDNDWKIEEDNYSNDLKVTIEKLREEGKSLTAVKSSILKESEDEVLKIRNMIKENENNLTKANSSENNNLQPETPVVALTTGYNLNRIAGRDYARKHALTLNYPRWGNYESMGGDCTNFTSQCLYAAGVPFDNSGGYTWYWYSDSNRAPAWTHAGFFKNYALNNNTSSTSNYGLYARASDWNSVYLCDIVQLNSPPTHSMVISGVVESWGYKTDYLICQHSDNVAGRLLDYPLSSKTGTKYYIEMVKYFK